MSTNPVTPEDVKPFVNFPKEEIDQSITARFEKIAQVYSNNIAIQTRNARVTYAELDSLANLIANTLINRYGSMPRAIALMLDDGVMFPAAMLGVMKAGSFFVLLEPANPTDRNDSILAELGCKVVVTSQLHIEQAHRLTHGSRDLLSVEDLPDNAILSKPRLKISPDTISYVVFTSGSTGKPKCVLNNHRSRLHTARAFINAIRLSPLDNCILLSSSTANAISNSLFALLTGATLTPYDVRAYGLNELANWIETQQVTICSISAALFRKFCATFTGRENFETLRILRLTSEPSFKSDFELYKRFFPQTCSLVNMLLPAETGLLRHFFMNHHTDVSTTDIPLGYAVEDNDIVLSNDNGQKVGPDEIGEIVVRSKYLSPGYWNNPELTEARFKPDPDDPEKRLYFTGDLGLMLPDGCLIHKGRKDFRVKIRGYGVDLLEVEKAIRSHPLVKEAVVITSQTRAGDSRLLAYYTSDGESSLSTRELAAHLRDMLPDYMIPLAFTKLEVLPLNSNGKIDRQSLPTPQHHTLGTEYVAPRNETESKLTEIWEQVLDVWPIGIDDSFFEIGGHSLLAAQMFSGIDTVFGRRLPLSLLVSARSIRLLAGVVSGESGCANNTTMVPFTQTGALAPLFTVPGVYGNVVGFADLARGLGANQPFYALQSVGLDGAESPVDSVETMAERFITELRKVQAHGPYCLLGACFGSRVTYEMAYQLLKSGEEVQYLALLDPIGMVKNELAAAPDEERRQIIARPAFVTFLAGRLRIYFNELKQLENRSRLKFLADKVRHFLQMVKHEAPKQGIRREYHQLAVYRANSRAGVKFRPKPLKGHLRSFEIYLSEHPRNSMVEGFDWNTLWHGEVFVHRVFGKDSGDMVQGENARALANLIARRLIVTRHPAPPNNLRENTRPSSHSQASGL